MLIIFLFNLDDFLCTYTCTWSFPSDSAAKNPPAVQEPQETWVRYLGREDLLEEGVATHSSILAWRIPMDRGRSLVG